MLNSLEIKNFRALEDFRVEKLGRVNLIVGKNNSGKSTVLEALRIYAANGNPELLQEIAMSHDEPCLQTLPNHIKAIPFKDFFFGRMLPQNKNQEIRIGDKESPGNTLEIKIGFLKEESELNTKFAFESEFSGSDSALDKPTLIILRGEKGVAFAANMNSIIPSVSGGNEKFSQGVFSSTNYLPYAWVPTSFINSNSLAGIWDNIAYTENEAIIIRALQIVQPDIENILFVNGTSTGIVSRVAKVKLKTEKAPIPLKSLGEGMTRLLQLSLNFPSAKGGFLLIDEFENGLHYSVQEKVWALVFEMAQQLDIQVFATTHSWDCIQSFAKVARERQDVAGILFRVGRSVRKKDEGKIIATVFDEEELYSITQNSIEVR